MEQIVQVLSRRDGVHPDQVRPLVEECVKDIKRNPMEAYDIMRGVLGLEPDYIDFLI